MAAGLISLFRTISDAWVTKMSLVECTCTFALTGNLIMRFSELVRLFSLPT
jgi:hypothetical protein